MLKKRFAAHVLMFNCDQFILRMIDNCAPFVEKIFVAYSEVPWSYNPKARHRYENPTNKELLQSSRHLSKIELIEGVWDRDEDQRNACLDRARAEGFDYLIIQDADEFYTNDAYERNVAGIIENPDWDVYSIKYFVFWKSLQYVIGTKDGSITTGDAPFALNCHSNIRFLKSRSLDSLSTFPLDGLCYHLAYVLSDDELHRKINTWTHSHEFNTESWFKRKWVNWTEETRNLHPIQPSVWQRAVRFSGDLPECLAGFDLGEVSINAPGPYIYVWDWLEDRKANAIGRCRLLKHSLLRGNR
jgi:hypothetical protein